MDKLGVISLVINKVICLQVCVCPRGGAGPGRMDVHCQGGVPGPKGGGARTGVVSGPTVRV